MIDIQKATCEVCGHFTLYNKTMSRFLCKNVVHEHREAHLEQGLTRVTLQGGFAGTQYWLSGSDKAVLRGIRMGQSPRIDDEKTSVPDLSKCSPVFSGKDNEKILVPDISKVIITPSVENTLNERASRYGKFEDLSKTAQEFKAYLHLRAQSNPNLKPHHYEALEMILHKIARILNGDPDYIDNWHDIAGYATLVEKILKGEGV